MWTKSKILDILRNHEMESAALERQIAILTQALEADLEEIRSDAYPGAVTYDRERVQSSKISYDERFALVAQACEERRAQHKRDIRTIFDRLQDIRAVYTAIIGMDVAEKSLLLNLYYPRTTAEELAEKMGCNARTIWRNRMRAVEKLQKILENQ